MWRIKVVAREEYWKIVSPVALHIWELCNAIKTGSVTHTNELLLVGNCWSDDHFNISMAAGLLSDILMSNSGRHTVSTGVVKTLVAICLYSMWLDLPVASLVIKQYKCLDLWATWCLTPHMQLWWLPPHLNIHYQHSTGLQVYDMIWWWNDIITREIEIFP